MELARAASFANEPAWERFTLAAALLRVVSGHALRVAPTSVPVDRTCARCGRPHGRPRIVGYELGVSVAHSADIAVVAASHGCTVGVDVEHMRPLDFEPLLDEVCSPTERLGVTDGASFVRLWTRKEAVLKATGDGLTVPMRSVVLTSPPAPPGLVSYTGRLGVEVAIADLEVANRFAAAAAVLTGAPVRFRVRDATVLLSSRHRPWTDPRGASRFRTDSI